MYQRKSKTTVCVTYKDLEALFPRQYARISVYIYLDVGEPLRPRIAVEEEEYSAAEKTRRKNTRGGYILYYGFAESVIIAGPRNAHRRPLIPPLAILFSSLLSRAPSARPVCADPRGYHFLEALFRPLVASFFPPSPPSPLFFPSGALSRHAGVPTL